MAAASISAQLPYVQARHLSYSIIYDYSSMSPAIVYYNLEASHFEGSIKRKPKHFKMDYLLPPPRVRNDAFTFSGYQRGHLCPSGDRDSRKDWFRDTFFTSNILPMTDEVNAGAWKDIELHCRKLALAGHILQIACGPVWSDSLRESSTSHKVSVPGSIWKIAKCTVHPSAFVLWVVPNDHTPRKQFQCRHDLRELPTLTPPIITNYLQLWLQTKFQEE